MELKNYSSIDEPRKKGKKAVLCLVVGTKGSTPRKAGAKMLVYPDGTIEGTIGGGSIEKEVIIEARKMMDARDSVKKEFNLGEDLGMHCGGSMEVYMEPLMPQYKLYIFGAGHIGQELARFASQFGFQIIFIDERRDVLDSQENMGYTLIHDSYVRASKVIEFPDDAFIVIVTPNHKNDEVVLSNVAKKKVKYIGMIGSNRKVKLARERFLEEKILSQEQLDFIDMPIGIPIKGETPDEIAISILAKLIDVKNKN